MKTAVDLGLAVGKRNRSALADVTNSKIATRASARAAQGKVQSDAPFLELCPSAAADPFLELWPSDADHVVRWRPRFCPRSNRIDGRNTREAWMPFSRRGSPTRWWGSA